MDAGKTGELLDRPSHRGDRIMQVELDDLLPTAGAGVLDPDGGGELAVGRDLAAADPEVAHLEAGVGAPVAEGEQRGGVQVGGAGVFGAERRLQIGARLTR